MVKCKGSLSVYPCKMIIVPDLTNILFPQVIFNLQGAKLLAFSSVHHPC